MKDDHIIKILEEAPADSLSESERAVVLSHINHCAGCARVFEAAQVSAVLLKARAAERVEPSPFFKTRVMVALRERQYAPEKFALSMMWRAARSLVSSMLAIIVILVALTVYFSKASFQSQSLDPASSEDVYSPEWVLLSQGIEENDITYGEVLTTLYDLQEDYGEDK